MAWALDLDGVVWRGEVPIDGSADAIGELGSRGIDVIYVTNSSSKHSQAYVDKLERCGIRADVSQVVHAGHAVAHMVGDSERVLVCAGDGVVEGLKPTGVELVYPNDTESATERVDSVIIGLKPDYDLALLTVALRAVLNGARLIGTNMDPLYPTPEGMQPGTGSLVSAVAYATKADVTFGGKPNQPMIDLLNERAAAFGTQVEVLVGDQPATDGVLAQRVGAKFGLVHTGVTRADHGEIDIPVATEAADLQSIVAAAGREDGDRPTMAEDGDRPTMAEDGDRPTMENF